MIHATIIYFLVNNFSQNVYIFIYTFGLKVNQGSLIKRANAFQ